MKTSSKPSASALQPGAKVLHQTIGEATLLDAADGTARISFSRGCGTDGTPIIGLAIVAVSDLEPAAPPPAPEKTN